MTDEAWHGTPGGYTNHNCRCDDCRAAKSLWQKHRREHRRANPEQHPVPHGTTTGYDAYRCRCSECTEAKRVASQAYRSAARTPEERAERAAEVALRDMVLAVVCPTCDAPSGQQCVTTSGKPSGRWHAPRRRTATVDLMPEPEPRRVVGAGLVEMDGFLVLPEWWHGTITGYTYHRCRCEPCTGAMRRYTRARRAFRRAHPEQFPVPHGTVIGYKDYRCRCPECTEAGRADAHRYSARRQARRSAERQEVLAELRRRQPTNEEAT